MSKELFVRGISFEATEDDLRNLFSVSGKVVHIHLINDPRTGQFKGAAFVKMASEKEAKDALQCLDGAILINREISVEKARPQGKSLEAQEKKPERTRTSSGWTRVPEKPKTKTQKRPGTPKTPGGGPKRGR